MSSQSLDSLAAALDQDKYLVRAKVFKFLGQAFHVYDADQNLILYCKLKAFKLKEDIRLFASEEQQTPLMAIKARSVIDFSAAYDVIDLTAGPGSGTRSGETLNYANNAEGGVKVGALRRKGMASLLRDSWELLGPDDRPIGTISEDGTFKALVRRFVDAASLFMPQAFHGEVNGKRVFEMKQNFNPFVRKLECDFSHDPEHTLDRRLGVAAAILLMAIEGKQS